MMNTIQTLSAMAVTAAAGEEQKLIDVLKSADASRKDKADACRELGRMGSPAAIKPLAALLDDEEMSHMARYGLEPNPSLAVDVEFRTALGKLKGKLLAGVCGSIGVRKDKKAVALLGEIARGSDAVPAAVAARSLGNIGTDNSLRELQLALKGAKGDVQLAVFQGLLRCAEALNKGGKAYLAKEIYESIGKMNPPRQISIAAALALDCI
ncbi:hypothetical protein K8I31_07435 [bacterium]|nr:hypothetical protein [bacterium]